MSTLLYEVRLTSDELIRLDGLVRPVTQEVIDKAKKDIEAAHEFPDLPEKMAAFVSSVVEEASKEKRIVWRPERIRYCKLCGKDAGYAKYTRSGRYHSKGATNFSKPLFITGYELADRFLVVKGTVHLGACVDCMNALKPYLKKALERVEAELPQAIMGVPSLYKRVQEMKCESCGWVGSEEAMKRLPALLGGSYPGGCPECPNANRFGQPNTIKATGKYLLAETGTTPPR